MPPWTGRLLGGAGVTLYPLFRDVFLVRHLSGKVDLFIFVTFLKCVSFHLSANSSRAQIPTHSLFSDDCEASGASAAAGTLARLRRSLAAIVAYERSSFGETDGSTLSSARSKWRARTIGVASPPPSAFRLGLGSSFVAVAVAAAVVVVALAQRAHRRRSTQTLQPRTLALEKYSFQHNHHKHRQPLTLKSTV